MTLFSFPDKISLNKSIKEESNHPYIFMENVIPESTYLERMNRFATNACCISYKLDSRHFAPDKRNRWFATNIPFPNTFGAFNIKYSGRKKVASIKETWMKHWLSASDKDESWKYFSLAKRIQDKYTF